MASAEQLTPRSARVRRARRLSTRRHRAETGEFLAEGPQTVREALAVPGVVLEVFASADAALRHEDLTGSGRDDPVGSSVDWWDVGPEVIAAICGTVHPQGIVARCRRVDVELSRTLAAGPRLVVVCADIRDPGNAGAVIRCADAAGADAVVFTGDSVDPYNPKAVRASVGSLFHVRLTVAGATPAALAELGSAGLNVLAADGSAGTALPEVRREGVLDEPTAWLFGNEAWGLPAELRELADRTVAVPIYGRAESLNLATAAAVCLYASATAQREEP